MVQPRKTDEVALFRALRERLGPAPFKNMVLSEMLALFASLGIPDKRGEYILHKWSGKGWWDWGIYVFGGWFTPEAPTELTEREAR